MTPTTPLPLTGIVRRDSPTLVLVTELSETDRAFYIAHFTRRGWTKLTDETAAGHGADLAFARNAP